MESYKIFNAKAGSVREGVEIEKITLKMTGTTFSAVVVGEESCDSGLNFLPVDGAVAGERILFASLEKTEEGKWKIIRKTSATTANQAIVILRTPVAYRRSNTHTGDRKADGSYEPFPGRIITRGTICKGYYGANGFGQHLIVLVDAGVVFRAGYIGLPSNKPDEHYYMFNGERLLVATRKKREARNTF